MADNNQQQPNFREQVELEMRQPRPVVRDSLTDIQSEDLLTVYGILKEFLPNPFEQFEREFLRDEKPDEGIKRFKVIAAVYYQFLEEHPNAEHFVRLSTFTCITFMSAGGPKPESASLEQWGEVRRMFTKLLQSNPKSA